MYNLTLPNILVYRYIIGSTTIGIITPTNKKYFRTITEVKGNRKSADTGIDNGSCDCKLSPEEIASYVLKHKLR